MAAPAAVVHAAAAAVASLEAVPVAAAVPAVPDRHCHQKQPKTQPRHLVPAAAVAEALEAAGPAAVETAAALAAVVGPAAAAAPVAADGDLSREELQQQGCHCQKLTSWWSWVA